MSETKDSEEHAWSHRILGFIVGSLFIMFVGLQNNKGDDTKYKQDQVDDYDTFYSDCTDYLSENKIIDTTKAYELHKNEIIEDVVFQKKLGYFDEKETDTERILSAVCKSLDEFSKNESKEVIYDLDHPPREDPSTKDCDVRGCVYSY